MYTLDEAIKELRDWDDVYECGLVGSDPEALRVKRVVPDGSRKLYLLADADVRGIGDDYRPITVDELRDLDCAN